ncbi:MAG: hypothetical protein ACYSWQ_00315, partial [Planctomycetota bacterium]
QEQCALCGRTLTGSIGDIRPEWHLRQTSVVTDRDEVCRGGVDAEDSTRYEQSIVYAEFRNVVNQA